MKRRRLYFIGKGGTSWRDPRNWSRSPGGTPLRRLHARGRDRIVVCSVRGHRQLDLRGMPYAAIEVTGYEGRLRLPDGQRLDFPQSRLGRLRGWFLMRRKVRPKMLRGLERNVARAGGWQRSVRDGIATLVLTPRGWLVVPRLAGGAIGFVQKSTGVGGNGGGTGAATPTNMPVGSTQGNLLVATCSASVSNSGGNFTCSDGAWVRAAQEVGRSNVQTAIFYKPNCGAGEILPSFTYSLSSTHRVVAWEFSGVLKASPLDRTGGANGAGTSLIGPSPTATAGGTDEASGELVVSSDAFSFGSNYTHTSTDTYNNGATPTGNVNNDSTSQRTHYRFAYGFTTSNGAADSINAASSQAGTASVASTCIASFKVAINVTQTASLPYESLNALAVTNSEPYETLKGLQATAAEPYEAGAGIARPLAEPYESLRGIAGSAQLPFEALLALAVAKSLPYETLLGVRAESSAPFEALGGLTVAVSDPYEAVGGVAVSSGALPFEVLLGLASNAGLDFEALAELAADGTLPFEALGGVAQTAALPFESLSAVAAAVAALPYEALAGLAAAAGSPFEALEALAALAEMSVESLAGVAVIIVLPYETTGGVHVQALAELPYETLEGVAARAAMPLEALLGLLRTVSPPYESTGPGGLFRPGFVIGVIVGNFALSSIGPDSLAGTEIIVISSSESRLGQDSISDSDVVQTASSESADRPAGAPDVP